MCFFALLREKIPCRVETRKLRDVEYLDLEWAIKEFLFSKQLFFCKQRGKKCKRECIYIFVLFLSSISKNKVPKKSPKFLNHPTHPPNLDFCRAGNTENMVMWSKG